MNFLKITVYFTVFLNVSNANIASLHHRKPIFVKNQVQASAADQGARQFLLPHDQ